MVRLVLWGAGMNGFFRAHPLLLLCVSTYLFDATTRADSLTLEWDPSPDSDIAQYDVFYGEVGALTKNKLNVGLNTRGTLSGLVAGKTYAICVTAKNKAGDESKPSNLITYTPSTVPPLTLNPVPNQALNEGSTLHLQLSASSPDPSRTLSYSLASGPFGATVNPSTGVFSWTPGEADGPGSALVTVQVVDDSTPPLRDSKSFTIVVGEVNRAPALWPIGDQVAAEGIPLLVTVSGSDADLPANALSYTLVSGPPGATVDPVSGVFRWTPGIADGLASASVTVEVSDNQAPSLSDRATFTIFVSRSNRAPTLGPIANQVVSEGSLLSFGLNASDAETPASLLRYALVSGPPGATVNSVSGMFDWTPGEGDGPGNVVVTVQVHDNGTPPLTDSKSFAITVNEVNRAPVLSSIADQVVAEGSPLLVTVSASDADLPANTLTFGLVTGPEGAVVDPKSGVFRWTPSEADGPGNVTASIWVSDNSTPPAIASQSFTIRVGEVNSAPQLASIPNQTVREGNRLNLRFSAADADFPGNQLSYRLLSAPPGASVDAATGEFTWTPGPGQAGTTHVILVQVSDDGVPPLTGSQSFTVLVTALNAAPVLAEVADRRTVEESELTLTFSARDDDLPADLLAYRLVSAPAGATVDQASGTFRWKPTEGQGPATHTVVVQVSDRAGQTDSKSFQITVDEVNRPPLMQPIADQTVSPGQVVMLAVRATDPDLPANTLVYQLISGPSDATLDPATGIFTWRLPKSQASATYAVTVAARDSGSPALFDRVTFYVAVAGKGGKKLSGPGYLSWVAELPSGRSVQFTHPVGIEPMSGQQIHQLEASADLVEWVPIGVLSTDCETRDFEAMHAPVRFYRVRTEPVGMGQAGPGIGAVPLSAQ